MNTDAPEVSYCQNLEVRRPSFSQCSNDLTPDFAFSSWMAVEKTRFVFRFSPCPPPTSERDTPKTIHDRCSGFSLQQRGKIFGEEQALAPQEFLSSQSTQNPRFLPVWTG
jgi:hypothetical protein